MCLLVQEINKKHDTFIEKRDVLKDIEELAVLQSKVIQVRVVEKLDKQGFHKDAKDYSNESQKL